MCKVAGVAGIKDYNRARVWEFMKSLGELMTFGNNDGLGYAAFDKNNNIFGEKWLHNHHAFKDYISAASNKNYVNFGESIVKDEAKAIILHTRFATCARGILNAHPHLDNLDKPNAALIHNGMITNDYEFTKKHSTCDSEVLVHEYVKNNVQDNLNNLSKFTKDLSGWYTCLVLSKTKNNTAIIDVFSDSSRLNSAFIPNLGVRVYSTALYDIERVCKEFNYKMTDIGTIAPESAFRIDVDSGKIIDKVSIEVETWKINEDNDSWMDNWLKMKGYYND